MINLFPLGLFRGHVTGRPQCRPRRGEPFADRYGSQAEIDQLRMAVFVENDIPRLDIPMNHPGGVCLGEAFAYLNYQTYRLAETDRVLLDEIA